MTQTVRTLPTVALLYDVPLLAEALADVFEGFAELRAFRADGDAAGLLRSLRPDAVIVESADPGDAADLGAPVLRVDLKRNIVSTPAGESLPATPTAIRNALVAVLAGGAS